LHAHVDGRPAPAPAADVELPGQAEQPFDVELRKKFAAQAGHEVEPAANE
jgi:hypothetical protein